MDDHEGKMGRALSRVLRWGVTLSAVLLLTGLLLTVSTGDTSRPTGSMDPFWILYGDPFLEPSHILFLGFLVLIATPMLCIIYSIYSFTRKHEIIFIVITSSVLLILLVSFTLGIG